MRQYEEFDEPQNQSTRKSSYTWLDACLMLFQSPSIETFNSILADQKLTAQRAFFWVFIGGMLFGIALAPAYPFNELVGVMLLGIPTTEIQAVNYQANMLTIILVGTTIGGAYSVVGFVMQTWLLQRVGKIFRATGSYYDMFKLRGIYYPVILALRGLIAVTFGISSPLALVLMFGTMFLDILCSGLAMSAANKVSWREGLMMVAGMHAGIAIAILILASISLMG